MHRPLTALVSGAVGYGIGSIPVGVLVSHVARGFDVRDQGSGSMGSTNVLRTIGPGAAAATAALDVAKGTAAVVLVRRLGGDATGQAAAGLAAVAGHSWPVFAHFRGGRGVATAWGALVPISAEASLYALAGFGFGLASTQIVSVASLAAAASAAGGALATRARTGNAKPLVYALPASALVIFRHSANIGRLLRHEEPRMSLRRV
ncbi:MAG: glycerol-3-phosphate 1-O-acyltransferase PlsY [Candidatus Dormibacteria bacterium]